MLPVGNGADLSAGMVGVTPLCGSDPLDRIEWPGAAPLFRTAPDRR